MSKHQPIVALSITEAEYMVLRIMVSLSDILFLTMILDPV